MIRKLFSAFALLEYHRIVCKSFIAPAKRNWNAPATRFGLGGLKLFHWDGFFSVISRAPKGVKWKK